MQSIIVVATAALLLLGCVTQPKVEPRATPIPVTPGGPPAEESIDIYGLQKSFRMTRPAEDLGYDEKAFDSCLAGFGFSPTKNCRRVFLTVIHFRLQCRDSDGTVSEVVSHAELRAVTSNHLRWNLGKLYGVTKTDGDGYGQVVAVTSGSARSQRFRLTRDNDFLALPAGDVRRIIVPRTPWCN